MDLNLKIECQTSRNVKRMLSKNSKGAQLMLTDTIQMFSMYKRRKIFEKLRRMNFMCLLYFVLLSTSKKSKRESTLFTRIQCQYCYLYQVLSECIISSQVDMITTL